MKDKVVSILRFLNLPDDERTARLYSWIFRLDAIQPERLKQAGSNLLNEIKQVTSQNYQRVGFYYLFLGCIYYEQDNYQDAIHNLQNAVNEISGGLINKSLTHWLLGLSYLNAEELTRAGYEYTKAISTLNENTIVNTLRINAESEKKQIIQEEIKKDLNQLLSEDIRFQKIHSVAANNTQEIPKEGQSPVKMNPNENVSQKSPSEILPPKTQENERIVYKATHTGGNISFQFNQTIQPASHQIFDHPATDHSTETSSITENTTTLEETRTDGYLSLQSLPVYEQMVAAGRSGKPEIGLTKTSAAEARIIFLNSQPHDVYPLKRRSNEIKIASNETNWGWVKVVGHSMNNIANKTSIKNGDFVLILFIPAADENDIVLASFEDQQTVQSFLTVKRYRKDRQILKSESTEKGEEYNDIQLGDKNNAKIIGVIYAVAKPFDAY